MKTVLVYFTLLGLFSAVQITVNKKNEFSFDPDITRNVSDLILSKGYPVENHVVRTKDGYLLSVQRIPHGKGGEKIPNKQAVFIQHGLLSSSSDWVINFPEQSLGFILADAGYDVWLGNCRGNTYSRRHVKYTPDMEVFWDYSFDQLAEYDFPAMIDYVLKETGEEQLFYIGHSQGTTGAFAMLSESLEYNKKIKLFVALAPVTTVGHITSAVKYLAPFTTEIEFLFEILGVKDFAPSDALMKYFSEYVCDTEAKFLCEYVMYLVFGADLQQLNTTRLGVYTAHTPAGSSVKSIVHYAQLVLSKKFTKFDYRKNNVIHYNQTTPPEYDVSKITAPVALLWALGDTLADPDDVVVLQSKLKSLVSSYCVPLPSFNHNDFVQALDANRLVYDEVMRLLKEFE
ncbi:hypothetical protein JTE90_016361 [Oedothorax gibbosus]|uniref:Lipase n=1 Tax=Oedothorax gibbosus TaxID=931172 RepID=A0AAV6U6Z2_9ARAC|nr:hypothetical protein JTE90_016361 [Oedothorax gibbosus]